MKKNQTSSQYTLTGIPTSNVVKKEDFQKRVSSVFNELGDILGRSFGPYGAPTIISNLAQNTVTKDGYTIMKNIIMDTAKGSPVDKVIYNLAENICARLNYKVGDGTTTAIIATISIYNAFMEETIKNLMESEHYLPRDIMFHMNKLKDEIIERIKERAVPIQNTDDFVEKIRHVVEISSNGDETITNLITEAYEKVGAPFLTCETSADNQTRLEIIEGYQIKVALADAIFIDSDDKTAEFTNSDVLIFDHAIKSDVYKKIIEPLKNISARLDRRLIIIAPLYDQTVLHKDIRPDILREYNATHKFTLIPLILTAMTANNKKALGDLAVLLNTRVIDGATEKNLISAVENNPIHKVMDISNRHIKDINIAVSEVNSDDLVMIEDDGETEYNVPLIEDSFRVGFARHVKAGLRNTTFSGFEYDESLYKKVLDEAYGEMVDAIEEHSRSDGFNVSVAYTRQRYNALGLKLARIEVGGDSKLSIDMLKDSVDDSIRAAEAAYNSGYILGCNITTMSVIRDMISEQAEKDTLNAALLTALFTGFSKVYGRVLGNRYTDDKITISLEDIIDLYDSDEFVPELSLKIKNELLNTFSIDIPVDFIVENIYPSVNTQIIIPAIEKYGLDKTKGLELGAIGIVQMYSIFSNMVFDLSNKTFTDSIINSANTDIEVLTAVMDLMSILYNGNQLVITSKETYRNI